MREMVKPKASLVAIMNIWRNPVIFQSSQCVINVTKSWKEWYYHKQIFGKCWLHARHSAKYIP